MTAKPRFHARNIKKVVVRNVKANSTSLRSIRRVKGRLDLHCRQDSLKSGASGWITRPPPLHWKEHKSRAAELYGRYRVSPPQDLQWPTYISCTILRAQLRSANFQAQKGQPLRPLRAIFYREFDKVHTFNPRFIQARFTCRIIQRYMELGIALTPLQKAYWEACDEYKNEGTRAGVFEKREAYLSLFWKIGEQMFVLTEGELRYLSARLRALKGSESVKEENTAKTSPQDEVQEKADKAPLTDKEFQAIPQPENNINNMEASPNDYILPNDNAVLNNKEPVEDNNEADEKDDNDVMDMEEIMRADMAATGLQKLSPEFQYYIRLIGSDEELLEDVFDFGCFLGLDQ